MSSRGFDLTLEVLTEDVIKNSETEGEILEYDGVGSSLVGRAAPARDRFSIRIPRADRRGVRCRSSRIREPGVTDNMPL